MYVLIFIFLDNPMSVLPVNFRSHLTNLTSDFFRCKYL